MLRFMVHSSRITGILHRRCARSMEYPLASQNIRHFSDDQQVEEKDTKKISGFAKSYETLKSIADNIDKPIKDTRTFRELFRKSNFVDLGDPSGKRVQGEIYLVVGNDLYIDFGWKLHCICPRPDKRAHMYVCGAIVELKIEKLELSSRFLGESQDLTLNEADCQLIRLISSPEERASRDMPPAIIYEDPIKDIEDDKIAEKRARPKSHNMKWF